MINTFLFDLDGTLADTLDDIAEGINCMRSELSLPPLTRIDVLNAINNGAFILVRRCLPELAPLDEEKNKEYLEIFQNYYSKCYNNSTYLYEGIAESVAYLKKNGKKLGVLSNKPHEFVVAIIEKLFPKDTFDAVIGQGQFPAKPDPSSALHICSLLETQPSDCALVGDSNIDMQTAQNAGLYPIGVSWGYRSAQVLSESGAKIIVNSPRDITTLVEL